MGKAADVFSPLGAYMHLTVLWAIASLTHWHPAYFQLDVCMPSVAGLLASKRSNMHFGHGSVGKSFCCTSMQTRIWLSCTHVESCVYSCLHITPALWGAWRHQDCWGLLTTYLDPRFNEKSCLKKSHTKMSDISLWPLWVYMRACITTHMWTYQTHVYTPPNSKSK